MELFFSAFDDPLTPRRSDMLHGALAAKCFFEPAMNILWRTLDTMFPVVGLIRGVEKMRDFTGYEWQVRALLFLREHIFLNFLFETTATNITEDDLASLDKYCQRVRHLNMYRDDRRVASHIWFSIYEFRGFKLFPRLISMSVMLSSFGYEDLQCMFLAISPSILKITLLGLDRFNQGHACTFSHFADGQENPC